MSENINATEAVDSKSGFLDSLIGATELVSKEFAVEFQGGHSMRFKAITSGPELQELKNQAQAFLEGTKKKALWPPKYKNYFTKDKELLGQCRTFALTLIEAVVAGGVGSKMSEWDFIKLYQERPLIFEHLKNEYNRHHAAFVESEEEEEMEDAKKD